MSGRSCSGSLAMRLFRRIETELVGSLRFLVRASDAASVNSQNALFPLEYGGCWPPVGSTAQNKSKN